MPIYEFYCPDCHTVFSFFSSRVAPEARPDCPRCQHPQLERKPSRFATVRAGGGKAGEEEKGDSPLDRLDDAKMERAMESLAGEIGDFGDEETPDPHQLAHFMRRFGEVSGLEPGPKLQEMIKQLEAGADPDSLDDDFGGEDGDDDAAFAELFRDPSQAKPTGRAARRRPPAVDDTLYFL